MSRKTRCTHCDKELGAKSAYMVVHALDTQRYAVGVFCVDGCHGLAQEKLRASQTVLPEVKQIGG